ncbi:MAG: OmpP1/FadL family transporter [Longimicrobiales bacterium]
MRGITVALLALLWAARLPAQGVSVFAHGGCALARAGTGTADPCRGGSSVFYNPAALAVQPGAASVGLLTVFTHSQFAYDSSGARVDSDHPTGWVPSAWFAARAGRLGFGLGFWAPYGLSTAWPRSFEGRFVGYDNSLVGLYIQPTLAVELVPDRFAVGAGLTFVQGSVRIRRRVDLATTNVPGTTLPFSALGIPKGTDFVDADLDVDDFAVTFNAGVHVKASDRWWLGVRYLHAAHLDLSGSSRFTQIPTGVLLPPGNPLGLPAGTPLDAVLATQFAPGGVLSDQRLQTEITLPNQLVAGVRFQAASNIRLLLDYQWTRWSHFAEAQLDFTRAPTDTLFLDFRNTSTIRLGADYDVNERWIVRAGGLYNDAASPVSAVTPLLAEGQRVTVAAGIGYRVSDRFSADAGLEAVFQEDRPGSVRPRVSRSQSSDSLAVGVYSGSAFVLGLTMSYRLPDLKAWLQGTTTNR